ncbi:MAG: glycosyltransferase [Trueperaceae bacterium]|nr:glycosyltransferase [Trueperaceae bacterium]
MKILQIHAQYTQTGGEEAVAQHEFDLLRQAGIDIRQFWLNNQSFVEDNSRLAIARKMIWNQDYRVNLEAALAFKPDMVHIHNIFPAFSPVLYRYLQSKQFPMVQTLHNFRFLCANALFLRDAKPCERCLGKVLAYPAIQFGCYHNSRAQSAAVISMQKIHKLLGSFEAITSYIALSEFAKTKFVDGGYPEDRIFVKPNFLPEDPGLGTHQGNYALYVGRLSEEKGIEVLLEAWQQLELPIKLKIVGDGPLRHKVEKHSGDREFLGSQPKDQVLSLMKDASLLIIPSLAYENFPMTLVEAYATGLPVVVSGHGSLAEWVKDGQTGWHFQAGSARSLAERLEQVWGHRDLIRACGVAARHMYEERFQATVQVQQLLSIYNATLARRGMA